ncbi:uncharacterized protein LOC131674872 isoform X3 [Phymastichus coffea]|uniref:uncharacterized protein LOC131674872 isoform X3 n=1 Tax=Phymastichus coffea TaxID=108790 RepID=UPI00273B1095|nr:uncharacterized protein LOC131674872 isoform X3 [Phymastichus coffea]
MKFKGFFRRTWHPQQMESEGRFSCGDLPPKQCSNTRAIHETELGVLKSSVHETSSSPPSGSRAGVACHNGACKAHGLRPPHHRIENPWHYLKTIFLVSIIFAFIVWIIVYVLLTQYEVL